ncbi:tyrosine-protein phosphatase [Nocardia jinanensis]|uniref:Protein-tyrosine-phosphatase n=1 Tax=Nocardia jinanensis TaxID=382504 RepID=A0A917R8G5_9NOCA|nr:tyrosine-protein phosphatase [Nocardia jinanensis]GGK94712.1 protein-tyrosine-phosphatase [Nocardia jinanensis]
MVHRSARVPAAVLTGALVVFAPVAAVSVAAPPAVGDVLTVDRSLHLTGAPNARDLGGYRTIDGRTVRSGIAFRTDQLNNLTPADLSELNRLGVREVDDLRTVYERALGPDRVPAGARANWYDMIGAAPLPELMSTLAGGNDLYRAFITAPGANQAVAGVLRDIAASGAGPEPGAVLFHCTAGKDRTGWTAAVLLTVLGVDRATVGEDYLLSNHYRAAAAGDPVGGVRQEWLDSAFDQVARSYGSFDRYVSEGLGLGPAEIDALKQRMLS